MLMRRLCPWERRAVLLCAPDMISFLFYCLVIHASYPSVVGISVAMLPLRAWSGLASIAGVALLSRISRITLVTGLSGSAWVPRVAGRARVARLSRLPWRACLSGGSGLSLRCRSCLRWRRLATTA